MDKQQVQQAVLYCGIDVSAKELVVALDKHGKWQQRSFCNLERGHRALIAWLQSRGSSARVCLEATGIYGLDLAMALEKAGGIEVSVLNPRNAARFAETLRRSKTDLADAQVLAEYARRMPWEPWQPPPRAALQLRTIMRQVAAMTKQHTMQMNRLHSAAGSNTVPACVRLELKRSLRHLASGSLRLRHAARKIVAQDQQLEERFQLLNTVPGIADLAALQLLGELALMPPRLDVRQWVACSGLDPRHHRSGTSVEKASRISRAGNAHLRRALYMPALVASRHDPHLKAFYCNLATRRKSKLLALTAVARKMLHAIYGMFRSRMPYDGSRLFPTLEPCLHAT